MWKRHMENEIGRKPGSLASEFSSKKRVHIKQSIIIVEYNKMKKGLFKKYCFYFYINW